jgi:hypothetical protein
MSPLRAPRIVEPPELNSPHHRCSAGFQPALSRQDGGATVALAAGRPVPLRRRVVLCTKKPLKKEIQLADCRHKTAFFWKIRVISAQMSESFPVNLSEFCLFSYTSRLRSYLFNIFFLENPLPDFPEGIDEAPQPA